jgi:fatty acid desaturase
MHWGEDVVILEAREAESSYVIFERAPTSPRDQRIFLFKLAVAGTIGIAGVLLVLVGNPATIAVGVIVLGAIYAHMVELQHQCLHHSAFVKGPAHRRVGVVLGLPMLVSYTHYRVRHLQHHRYIGTERDTEFFGFDPRKPLTALFLLRWLFDYSRLVTVAVATYRAFRGTWRYDNGQISARARRATIAEYRLIGILVIAALVSAVLGLERYVLEFWAAPVLLVSTPLHFLIELPEHIRCDNDTGDVLRNTRSITGSWFSTWYTNGNNLHVEHHAAMGVPINRLPERHEEVLRCAKHTEPTYWSFYRGVLRGALPSRRG